jgi:hypothetical protein
MILPAGKNIGIMNTWNMCGKRDKSSKLLFQNIVSIVGKILAINIQKQRLVILIVTKISAAKGLKSLTKELVNIARSL